MRKISAKNASRISWSGSPEFSHFPAERLQAKTEFINQKCMIALLPRNPFFPTFVCGFCGCCGDVQPAHNNKLKRKRETKAARIIITAAKISWQFPGPFHGHPLPTAFRFISRLPLCGGRFFQFLVYATADDKIGWAWSLPPNGWKLKIKKLVKPAKNY